MTWSNRHSLREVQYRDDANLSARQSIYAYQRPRVDLPPWVLDLAALRGDETVADVGCGNGRYLAALDRRGHHGLVLGLDLSVGMLRTSGGRLLAAVDAGDLPLRDDSIDVALAARAEVVGGRTASPERAAPARVTTPGTGARARTSA